jgi:fermentation-respiration switch protein FrsA (DUF1100 family)
MEHVLYVMGAASAEEVSAKLQNWKLAPIAERIRCPLLITHGERDAQVPVEQAYQLYQAAGSTEKELKVFTEDEGGAGHCQNDNRLLAYAYVADWFEDTLMRGKRRRGVIVGWRRQE